VLYPVQVTYGVDLIWFGVFVVIMVEVGLLTPPVGMLLFIVQSISKADSRDVLLGCIPFIIMALVLLLVFLPQIVLWFPSLSG
jgi:TRAP-type C4-dicarboxylate transport system permease large subunit